MPSNPQRTRIRIAAKKPDPVAQLTAFLHTPRPTFEGECERLFFCLVAQRLGQSLTQHAEIMKRAQSTRRRAKAKKNFKDGKLK